MSNKLKKVILYLYDEERYAVYHALKQYLDLGLRIKKIHRGISLKEEPWLERYIELNTKLHANAKDDFEKISSS